MLNNHSIPIVSFVGFSGSGKTTLMTKIIKAFKEKGYRVGTIKHDAHRFEMDHRGKDTWKFADAGSELVIINSKEKFAMIENLERAMSFEEVLSRVTNVDVVFIEGYKHEFPPKILLVRREKDLELLSQLKEVVAIATSMQLEGIDIPIYNLDDYSGIVSLIQSKILGENENGTRE